MRLIYINLHLSFNSFARADKNNKPDDDSEQTDSSNEDRTVEYDKCSDEAHSAISYGEWVSLAAHHHHHH